MKILKILIGTLVLSAGLGGCTSTMYSSAGYAVDDLYGISDKTAIARKQKAEAEARKAEAEARKAQWEAKIAEAQAAAAEESYYNGDSYDSVLADTYESAYARRLRGFDSPSYRMPSSYYNFRYGSTFNYVSAYDPAFYNIVISGDQVWVEPRYITSMFGSWGATVYTGNWYLGWDFGPSYSWWGSPYNRWGWGGWNFGFNYYAWGNPWYNSWYGSGWHGGWYPGWHGHHHGHGSWRPYSSNIVRRPSAGSSPSGSRYQTGGRYSGTSVGTSPSAGRGGGRGNSFGVKPSSSGSTSGSRGSGSSSNSGQYNSGSSFNSGNSSSGSSSFNRGGSYNSGSSSSFNRGSSSSSSSGGGSRGSSGVSSSGGSYRNSGGR